MTILLSMLGGALCAALGFYVGQRHRPMPKRGRKAKVKAAEPVNG